MAPYTGGTVTVTGALGEPETETDGTYAYRFAAGSAFTLTLTPEEGKAVSAATLNGTAITLIGSGNTKTYAGTIEADSTLAVTFSDPQPTVTHRVTVTVINSSNKAVLVRADGEEVLGSFSSRRGQHAENLHRDRNRLRRQRALRLTDSGHRQADNHPLHRQPVYASGGHGQTAR